MKVGCFAAHEEYDPTTLLSHARRAEAVGFDSVWTSDHVHPWWHTGAECGAAWPWLGSALETTETVALGTGVTPPIGRYHPGMIAQTFATLGAMYPGRVFVTLGTGESMNEVPLGFEWPPYRERRTRLIEACEIIHGLWDGEVLDYDGTHWQTNACRLYTLPDERVPLYVAGNGPKTTRVAGSFADGFLTLADVDEYCNRLEPALEAGATDANRDPDDITRIRQLLVSYDDSYDQALEAVGRWRGIPAVGFDAEIPDPREIEAAGRKLPLEAMTDSWLVTTDPADIVTTIRRCCDAGFDEVELHSASPDQDRFFTMMADNVLPQIA